MKDVRLFFEKKGNLKFISHLDMNRFFTRLIRKTGLDIWYTEGFNPHPYIAFALPLPLGFESYYETVDFKVSDETELNDVEEAFKKTVPEGIVVLKAATPVMKSGKIAFAEYNLVFQNETDAKDFSEYVSSENAVIKKKSKRGEIKTVEIGEKIVSVSLKNNNTVQIILPAGNDNINPSLIISSLSEIKGYQINVSYIRTSVLDAQLNKFV